MTLVRRRRRIRQHRDERVNVLGVEVAVAVDELEFAARVVVHLDATHQVLGREVGPPLSVVDPMMDTGVGLEAVRDDQVDTLATAIASTTQATWPRPDAGRRPSNAVGMSLSLHDANDVAVDVRSGDVVGWWVGEEDGPALESFAEGVFVGFDRTGGWGSGGFDRSGGGVDHVGRGRR